MANPFMLVTMFHDLLVQFGGLLRDMLLPCVDFYERMTGATVTNVHMTNMFLIIVLLFIAYFLLKTTGFVIKIVLSIAGAFFLYQLLLGGLL